MWLWTFLQLRNAIITRINVIDVKELTDAHCLAELREITRIFTLIEKCARKPKDIPNQYVLGTGHCKFFLDKATYIYGRTLDLLAEWYDRGFNYSFDIDEWSRRYACLPSWSLLDYTPTPEAMLINRDRIAERINAKPEFYKYRGKKI